MKQAAASAGARGTYYITGHLFYVKEGRKRGRKGDKYLISAGYTYSKVALIAFFMINRASIVSLSMSEAFVCE